MKRYSRGAMQSAFVLGSALLFTAASLRAQNAQNGPGRFYVNGDVGVSFGDNVTSSLGFGNSSSSLNTGVRADLCGGYNFGLGGNFHLAPEFEVGYLYNSFANVSMGSASLNQVPLLVNGVLTWQFTPKWGVYGGLGIGADYMYISAPDDSGGDSGGVAWQGKIGIKYQFGPGELGLGYEYLGVAAPFIDVANHTLMASYTFHF